MTIKNNVLVWVVGAVVVAAVAWGAWKYVAQPRALGEPLAGGDTTAAIEKDLSAVDLGDITGELNQLENDINQL
ncbi:MAG: hypothetical protein HYS43_00655 [Candidatus Liptonbacteria bacterium]|nr:hypothetical protein [Candidatus Liptonbacteria bacterium]